MRAEGQGGGCGQGIDRPSDDGSRSDDGIRLGLWPAGPFHEASLTSAGAPAASGGSTVGFIHGEGVRRPHASGGLAGRKGWT